MPNHVRNVIKMKGIASLPLFTTSEYIDDTQFDFNKLIPMPESLAMVSGSVTDTSVIYYLTDRCKTKLDELSPDRKQMFNRLLNNSFASEWHQEMFNCAERQSLEMSDQERDEMYERGRTYVSNFEQYGATTWYDWCRREWGTKWNAYDTEIIDEDTVAFNTAWSSPDPVIQKLHDMYPDKELEHWYADEDMGNNAGYHYGFEECFSAAAAEDESDALAIYLECWGDSECIYRDEDGLLRKYDCETCNKCY